MLLGKALSYRAQGPCQACALQGKQVRISSVKNVADVIRRQCRFLPLMGYDSRTRFPDLASDFAHPTDCGQRMGQTPSWDMQTAFCGCEFREPGTWSRIVSWGSFVDTDLHPLRSWAPAESICCGRLVAPHFVGSAADTQMGHRLPRPLVCPCLCGGLGGRISKQVPCHARGLTLSWC